MHARVNGCDGTSGHWLRVMLWWFIRVLFREVAFVDTRDNSDLYNRSDGVPMQDRLHPLVSEVLS